MACGRQFRSGSQIRIEELWLDYQQGKQTISELAVANGISASTIKRRLREVRIEWRQPQISGSGIIHMDASYFDRNSGVLLVLEANSRRLLYMTHIAHEHLSDYERAVSYLESQGYVIRGIILDGNTKLFGRLERYPIQMCHFHFVGIIRRKLTKKPQLEAGRELLDLAYSLKSSSSAVFSERFSQWETKWEGFMKEKTTNPVTGKWIFTHQRLRSARLTVRTFLPWLFSFEKIAGMPNTNNLIEGTFTDMKKNLNMHPGMSLDNRIRFMNGFFLAYKNKHNTKEDD